MKPFFTPRSLDSGQPKTAVFSDGPPPDISETNLSGSSNLSLVGIAHPGAVNRIFTVG